MSLNSVIHNVCGGDVQNHTSKRICGLLRGKSDDSQIAMYTESLAPTTADISRVLSAISSPSRRLKHFCDGFFVTRQIHKELRAVLSTYSTCKLQNMTKGDSSAKNLQDILAHDIAQGLTASIFKGIFKKPASRVKAYIISIIRRILLGRNLGDIDLFMEFIGIDKMITQIIEKKLCWSAFQFVEDASSYKFDLCPTGKELDSILKARNIISRSNVVVLNFHSFYLITPFWRHFFTKSSFKLRDITGPEENFKKECICTMKRCFSKCPYTQKVFVNFEKERVRIQQISSEHHHTDEELIEKCYLGYLNSYIKFFVPVSTDTTATSMKMCIKKAICSQEIEDSETSKRLSALGFNTLPLSKFRAEVSKVQKSAKMCENNAATSETDITQVCTAVNNDASNEKEDAGHSE